MSKGKIKNINEIKQEKDLRYRDREWLYDQYVNQRKSTYEIGKECGIHNCTIGRYLNKFNIEIRSHSDTMKGKTSWNKGIPCSEITKQRISKSKKGQKHSKESKEKIRDALKEQFNNGKIQWNKGLKGCYSEESLQKMGHKKEENINWKGGKMKANGYICILKGKHPNASKKYVREHRLIIEREIGRYLWRWEIIHHINEIKDDNRIENLYLCKNESQHRKMHIQLERTAIQLLRSNKYGKIRFNREKGKYYIEYLEEVKE